MMSKRNPESLSLKMSDDYFNDIYDCLSIQFGSEIKKAVITLEKGKAIKITETFNPFESSNKTNQ